MKTDANDNRYSYPMNEGLRNHLRQNDFDPDDAPFIIRYKWRDIPIVACIAEYLGRACRDYYE